jgi:Tol biopolymer transport system component/DNA-binding winged helix-turn-helix (wHTH) protein
MLPQPSRAQRLAFGPFEFDSASGELRKYGYKVKLPSQPRQILGALLERPGGVTPREDLRNHLWPGATAGDFEHGLNAAVNKLRQALGDSASQPRYVETLQGIGYRFVAPVHPVGGAVLELVPPAVVAEPQPQASGLRLSWWIGVGAALLVVLAGASWSALRRPAAPAVKATQFVVVPPKGYYLEGGGLRQAFALSPDGGRIAFTAKDASGGFRLFLRDFAELESRPVADGEGAYSVVWMPDGQTLLFTAHGKLRRMAVGGAASQVLSDAVPYFSSAIPFGEGRLLVSNDQNSGVMPSSGGVPQEFERRSWAQTLPGGRDFLYSVDDAQVGSLRARIAPVGGNDPGIEVVQADSRVQYTGSLHSSSGYLVYLRSGTLLAQPFDLAAHRVTAEPKAIARRISSFSFTGAADFSVSERGALAYQTYISRSQFMWVDRTGKPLAKASPADLNSSFGRLSPDGRWLAAVPFDVDRGALEIWLYDAVTGAGRKAIFGPGLRAHPVWSPDGRRLVYVFANHGWPKLAVSSLDGAPDREPLPDTGFMVPTDWSSDGRYILYNNSAMPAITNAFASDVFAIDMARDHKIIPLLNTPFHEANATFSPDGKWLAYLSDESGRAEIYLQALDRGNDSLRVTGERFLVSSEGAQCLRWRKNGKELFYLAFDGRVYAVPLVFAGGRVRAGKPDALFTIDAEARATVHATASFDVSADGSRFVIPTLTPGESSALVVLQDWESLVAK